MEYEYSTPVAVAAHTTYPLSIFKKLTEYSLLDCTDDFISWSLNNSVTLYHKATSILSKLKCHNERINDLKWSSNSRLATVCEEGFCCIHHVYLDKAAILSALEFKVKFEDSHVGNIGLKRVIWHNDNSNVIWVCGGVSVYEVRLSGIPQQEVMFTVQHTEPWIRKVSPCKRCVDISLNCNSTLIAVSSPEDVNSISIMITPKNEIEIYRVIGNTSWKPHEDGLCAFRFLRGKITEPNINDKILVTINHATDKLVVWDVRQRTQLQSLSFFPPSSISKTIYSLSVAEKYIILNAQNCNKCIFMKMCLGETGGRPHHKIESLLEVTTKSNSSFALTCSTIPIAPPVDSPIDGDAPEKLEDKPTVLQYPDGASISFVTCNENEVRAYQVLDPSFQPLQIRVPREDFQRAIEEDAAVVGMASSISNSDAGPAGAFASLQFPPELARMFAAATSHTVIHSPSNAVPVSQSGATLKGSTAPESSAALFIGSRQSPPILATSLLVSNCPPEFLKLRETIAMLDQEISDLQTQQRLIQKKHRQYINTLTTGISNLNNSLCNKTLNVIKAELQKPDAYSPQVKQFDKQLNAVVNSMLECVDRFKSDWRNRKQEARIQPLITQFKSILRATVPTLMVECLTEYSNVNLKPLPGLRMDEFFQQFVKLETPKVEHMINDIIGTIVSKLENEMTNVQQKMDQQIESSLNYSTFSKILGDFLSGTVPSVLPEETVRVLRAEVIDLASQGKVGMALDIVEANAHLKELLLPLLRSVPDPSAFADVFEDKPPHSVVNMLLHLTEHINEETTLVLEVMYALIDVIVGLECPAEHSRAFEKVAELLAAFEKKAETQSVKRKVKSSILLLHGLVRK